MKIDIFQTRVWWQCSRVQPDNVGEYKDLVPILGASSFFFFLFCQQVLAPCFRGQFIFYFLNECWPPFWGSVVRFFFFLFFCSTNTAPIWGFVFVFVFSSAQWTLPPFGGFILFFLLTTWFWPLVLIFIIFKLYLSDCFNYNLSCTLLIIIYMYMYWFNTVAYKTAPMFACFLKIWVLWLNEWIIFQDYFCVLNYVILTFQFNLSYVIWIKTDHLMN